MKYLFTILLSVFAFQSFAQIQVTNTATEKNTVGKCKRVGTMIAELTYTIEEGDTLYYMMFKNEEYKHIIDYKWIRFSGVNNTVNEFYNILKSVFLDENKKNKEYKVSLKLGETNVIVSNFRMMGFSSCMVWTDKGYVTLSEREIDKLFGK